MLIVGGLMVTKDRRWYDNHFETQKTLSLLQKLSEEEKETLSESLISIVKEIKQFHRNDYEDETKEPPLSLGIDRVIGLYQSSNGRRWYDKSDSLGFALKAMSTLPESDFRNIMDGLSVTLSSRQ